MGTKEITITVTPSGYADAVQGDRFIMPEERRMPLSECLDIMEGKTQRNGIFYIQKQNSNFLDEFSELLLDAEEDIPWATEALGRLKSLFSHKYIKILIYYIFIECIY